MSGAVILALRLIMAIALYGFLGWTLLVLWQEIRRQGINLAGRRAPSVNLTIRHGQTSPIIKNFSQPGITLGRDPSCDIPLIDDTVSTLHAQLTYHHNQWWLEDLSSTNGTMLNQITITMPTVLTAGDEIQCGDTKLIVNLSTNTLVSPTQKLGKKT
jgi:pSer/pThr/pTyr-binding forkhead associated (FHA) protein